MRRIPKGPILWTAGVALLSLTLLLPGQPTSKAQSSKDAVSPSINTPAEAKPAEEEHPVAFDYLPKTKLGYVDWVKAIKEGAIKPRESLDDSVKPMPPIDFDVVFKVNVSGFPDVVYPHYPHTIWLDCRNCHPSIFLMRAGANQVTMAKILQGEFCGRCHGKVAFPISDCFRCHSRPK